MEPDDFTPPSRKSMSDAELEVLVKTSQSDEAGILQAMEVLSEQAKLREQDDQEFASWIAKLEAVGTDEAKLAVTNAKRALEGLPPQELPKKVDVEPEPVLDLNLKVEEPPIDEIRPMSALAEIGIVTAQNKIAKEPTVLEHDLAPLLNNHELDEIVDVEVDLSTGVAVSDFDAILQSRSKDDDASLEPENFGEQQEVETQFLKKPASRAASQFWAWLGLTSGILPIGLGFLLAAGGLHGLQAFCALAAGLLASGFVVSVGAVAGKRAGLTTLMVSRATFGVHGNLIPGVSLVFIKFAALCGFGLIGLQLLDKNLFSMDLRNQLLTSVSSDYAIWAIPVLAALFIAALLLLVFGESFSYRAKQAIGIIGLAAPVVCVSQIHGGFSDLFSDSKASWSVAIAAALLIFAAFGALWSSSSADHAKDVTSSASGFRVYAFAKLGFTLLPLVSGSIGIVAATNFQAKDFDFVAAISTDNWATVVNVALLAVSIIGLLLMGISSVTLGLVGLGVKTGRNTLTLVVSFIALLGSLALFANKYSIWEVVPNFLPVIGVLLLAWTGTFVAEVLIRRIAYHEVSLQRAYGIYRSFNWVSITGFLISIAVGLGFVSSNGDGVNWVGYFIRLISGPSYLQTAQLGLALAFLLSALFPVVFGIGKIKRQEAEVLAIENRRNDLNNVAF